MRHEVQLFFTTSPGLVAHHCTLVQMSEGLHFGVVPYVSRPALGVVSGMVGAGGNLGAVFGSFLIVAPTYPTDEGFINLGIVIMSVSLLMFLVYFPDKGGMLVKAGGLGSYDPQIIKPPADYRGSDSMDYEAAKKKQAELAAAGEGVTVSKA